MPLKTLNAQVGPPVNRPRSVRQLAPEPFPPLPEGFPPPAAQRIAQLPPYILNKINLLNDQLRARGVDVIDFGMGNPADGVQEEVVEELRSSLKERKNHRYSAPRGILQLKEAFARHYARHFQVELNPKTEVLMSIGSKDALSHLCLAILNPNDSCVTPTPAYMIHRYAPVLAGAHTIGVEIEEEQPGVRLLNDIQELFERVYPRPKMLILNFPHNPTAKVVDLGFFEEAVALARHFKFFLLNDFAYGHTCFDGYQAPSLLQVKGAKEVAVETFTMSKPYNMAGWRLGFLAGNPHLVELLGRVKTYFDYGHFQCVQLAAAVALERGDAFIRKQAETYKRRLDVLLAGMAEADWGPTVRNKATMFTWQPLPEKWRGRPSIDFCMALAEKAGVSLSPGAGFGEEGEGHLRLALVETEERIKTACERIAKFLKEE
jgi:alanine-synthesizing transaminase